MNIYKHLQKKLGERVRQQELLAPYTTFKIGGPADYFFEARTQEELVNAVRASNALALPFFLLGGGSNILVSDKGYRGLVIRNSTNNIAIRGMYGRREAGRSSRKVFVEADSGVNINTLVRFTIEEGLGGLEMHLGLPGTVGGAVYMNAKWIHPEGYLGDTVYKAEIVTPGGEVKAVPKSYFRFAYDYSCIQKTKDIVISVTFAFNQEDRDTLWATANESIAYRRRTQPQGVRSAGCVFRNISPAEAVSISTPHLTTSVGYLIDHSGAKGLVVGDASISPVHANFIVNNGKAKAQQVIELIERVKAIVKQRYNITLSEEIVRVGEFT